MPKRFKMKKTINKNKLEKEFEELANSIGEQIQNHLELAAKELRAAMALADQYGIPFFANISSLGQPYVPSSFIDTWSDLDKEFVANLTDTTTNDLRYGGGWQISELCN
jgi:hypothetical protein